MIFTMEKAAELNGEMRRQSPLLTAVECLGQAMPEASPIPGLADT